VVGVDFVRELGLDPLHASWADAGRNLVSAYGTRAWQTLALQRLRAPEGMFAAR
jgi:hypothetical protein